MWGWPNAQEFTHAELEFLEAIANIVITAIENERLEGERAEMQRLENELDIAAKIQTGLLPLLMPPTPGLDVAADSQSSRQIGGDYYDIIQLDEQKTLLAIADVSGKGVPAALLMANVQAALTVLARLRLPLTHIVDHINRLVVENTEPEVFVTMFLAVIDTATNTIEYVNAGHNPPVLLRGNDVHLLEMGGVLTGVLMDPPPYRMGVGGVGSGDILVLYTDGVTETFNGSGHEYGVASLVECLRGHRMEPSSDILQSIKAELRAFSGNANLADDTSLVVVRVT
ncbi:MAG: PP2C family protein-serine/threonine phosphatase [Candidatus Kapabacteria bacterium]|nr:PP2C family protein-serine/threonine phosphatase [Candidatus Kapabacteria bacterium]